MKLRFGAYFGAFVVLLSGGFIAVRFFGAHAYTIQLAIALLVVVVGLDAIVSKIAKKRRKEDGNANTD